MEDPAAARVAPSNGKVATWTNKDVGKWLKEVQLGQFAEDFEKRGVNGPLLLTLEDNSLSELGVTSTFDKHKLRFELGIARSQVTDEDRDQFVDPADSKTELSKPGVDVVDGAVAMGDDALAATKEELEDEKYFGFTA